MKGEQSCPHLRVFILPGYLSLDTALPGPLPLLGAFTQKPFSQRTPTPPSSTYQVLLPAFFSS